MTPALQSNSAGVGGCAAADASVLEVSQSHLSGCMALEAGGGVSASGVSVLSITASNVSGAWWVPSCQVFCRHPRR